MAALGPSPGSFLPGLFLIMLTKAGEQAVDVFAPLLVEVLDRVIFGTLSSDEIETLVGLLTRISKSAQQLLEE